MKSPMVLGLYDKGDPELARYSDLQVMRSGAGWYIGTVYSNPDGYEEPGSRDSEYFPTKEAAQFAFDNDSWDQRYCP